MIQQKRCNLNPKILNCNKISSVLNIPPIIGQLLLNRQKNSIASIKEFIHMQSEDAQFSKRKLDHFLKLVRECINNNQPIFLFGDYDVDGMTSKHDGKMFNIFRSNCAL